MSGRGVDRFSAMSEINVTPLVDIMLVLLIIFMVTAPLLNHGVEVDLPQATAKPLPTKQEPLVISVLPDGTPAIEDRPMSMEGMVEKVVAIRRANPSVAVYVRGDRAAEYGSIMKVMGSLQSAGIDQVGLVTEPQ
uniref:Protein tolR n=1 Tax=Magnetococcus massalia (strain MO-1) TaxID=451514 RepID=A0A1S7LLZ7_MAGMO|nr:Protein tolR [Candidatus Magnetococcus massalia]